MVWIFSSLLVGEHRVISDCREILLAIMCNVSKFEDKVAEIHGYTENRSVNEKIMAETIT